MILDTNALSAIADDAPGIKDVLARASEVVIPTVVLGEYRFGILQSKKRDAYERWLQESLPRFSIFAIEESTTHFYAAIRRELKNAGKPIPSNDVWIAALTRQHRLPLLSRDRHFDAVPRLTRLTW